MKPFIKELKKKFNVLNNQIDTDKEGEFFIQERHDRLIKSRKEALEELQALIDTERQRNY